MGSKAFEKGLDGKSNGWNLRKEDGVMRDQRRVRR